jgi:hypothetical protein
VHSFPTILQSGTKIYLDRGSQYGTATIRIHIFRLPEAQ